MRPDKVYQQVERAGDGPADRVGGVENAERVVRLEIGVNPDDAEAADADEGDERGQEREADAAQRADKDIHDAAEEIHLADDTETRAAVRDGDGAVGVDAHQRFAENESNRVKACTE